MNLKDIINYNNVVLVREGVATNGLWTRGPKRRESSDAESEKTNWDSQGTPRNRKKESVSRERNGFVYVRIHKFKVDIDVLSSKEFAPYSFPFLSGGTSTLYLSVCFTNCGTDRVSYLSL